ncbi:PIN2/TERF1-interacting telomerase inhibitor 1 [Lampris incognitus]|uniref:PIN2/TERF1-interacting telomerase inhibitor 1 n=1 Tax=Lampris incognitus TaxID=2546036 RepID=UPI0024B5B9E4|nr:PIN2/TERF1-interacting telomerase inhibitor 1 [Lampris incognitus]
MSMLAEPRRKVKWSVDPRNSTWSNDESKFGQKMLERMGWSKGKGLGKTEQGSTDHIKVKVKNDSLGLGTTVSHEDNWIAHQDDFNQLLAELNNCHGQNNNKESLPEQQQGFSLEEKSKTSKKRVHYMKFTKGKDLSCRTEKDLNCIFGKRAKHAKDEEEENNSSSDSQWENENEASATPEPDTESVSNTVTSSLTMQEYFAQRMAQLKRARSQAQNPASSLEAETTEMSGLCEEPDALQSNDSVTEKPKKKKKKISEAVEDMDFASEMCTSVTEENEDQEQACLGKKKKKRKVAEEEGAVAEDCSSAAVVEPNCEDRQSSSKKKKLKRNQENNSVENQTVESEHAHKKKKKKKKKRHEDVVLPEENKVVMAKKSKKDKKKKKE